MFPTALDQEGRHRQLAVSAQYGADAVGGVVNFVLDRDFTGPGASASTGVTEVGDGFNHQSSSPAASSRGEKLHVVASVEYTHIDQIQRDPGNAGQLVPAQGVCHSIRRSCPPRRQITWCPGSA
ncbi:MAG: hypothetical protein IPM70_14160 [Proteobacteria bacterium]|nr:hypothetical protein [Pseudomonadota bacterium]